MKKKIIIGSILCLFLLITIPSIPAIELSSCMNEYKSQITKNIQIHDENHQIKSKSKLITLIPAFSIISGTISSQPTAMMWIP